MKEVNLVKFSNGKEIFAVLLMWCLVVCTLYTAFQVFTIARVAANFITFGFGTILISGIVLPLFYTKIIKGLSLELIGITKKKLKISIFIGIVLTIIQYSQTLINVRFPDVISLIPRI